MTNPRGRRGVTGGRGRRELLRATVGSALGVSLAGCTDVFGSAEATDDRLRVGVLAHDPERSVIGGSIAATALGYVEMMGGLAGRDTEVIVENTKASPLQARRAYDRLILDENVDLTLGITDSGVIEHLLEPIAEHETIHITTGATTQRVTEHLLADPDRYRFHFRTMLNEEQIMAMELAFIQQMFPQFGFEPPYRLALLAEDYPWADGVIDGYQAALSQVDGFEVAMAERYHPEIDDFRPLYAEVEEHDADIAWVSMGHTGDAAMIDWQRSRPSFAFGGTHVPMQHPGYWDMIDGACKYGISRSPATPQAEITPMTQQYLEAFSQASGGEYPIYSGYLTFDALQLYDNALAEAGTTDPDVLIPALEDVEVTATMAETFAFGDRDYEYPHDPVWSTDDIDTSPGAVYYQWQDDGAGSGAQEVIWPDNFATASYEAPPWLNGA